MHSMDTLVLWIIRGLCQIPEILWSWMALLAEEPHDMKYLIAICLLLLITPELVFAAAAPSTVWVHPAGLSGGCSTREATLQAAIDRVADGGSVKILSDVVISGDAARGLIENKEVNVYGGFQNCTSLHRDGYSVLDGSGTSSAGSLIKLVSDDGVARDVVIADLELTGNVHEDNIRGGGLQIWGRPNLSLKLQSLNIHGNSAEDGGGIFISGQGGNQIGEVRFHATRVYDNVAGNGGGILCGLGSMWFSPGSHVGVSADGQPAGNFARSDGGGIFAERCDIIFDSVGAGANIAAGPLLISNNRTYQGHGGGLYVSSGEFSTEDDLVQTKGGEVEFSNNRAGNGGLDISHSGGGIYLGSGRLFMDGGKLKDNSASGHGGGIAVVQSYAWFSYSEMDPSWDCTAPGLGCVQISGNSAYYGGGISLLWGSADVIRVVMDGNRSRYRGSAAAVRGDHSELKFKHTAVINSEAYDDDTLARYALYADDRSKIVFDYSTLAHGLQGSFSGSVPPIAVTAEAVFEADSSIIWDNHGNKIAEATGTVSITNSLLQFTHGSGNLVADPLFTESSGFHISASSPAIGFATDSVDRDIDRQSRGGTNATDAGADEADGNRVGILGNECAYETLNEALAAGLVAYTNPLDYITLRVQPGVYAEHLIVPLDRRLKIEVAESHTCTQANPDASPWAVIIQGKGTWARGGVIELKDDARLVLRNLTLLGGKATLGGNVYIASGGSASLYNTQVFNGTATSKGGGVRVYGGTLKLYTDSIISANDVTGPGGGVMADNGFVYLYDTSRIGSLSSSNESSSLGGGLYLKGSELHMYDNSSVLAGRAVDGGGVYATGDSLVQVEDLAAIGAGVAGSDNHASGDGGGVYLSGTGTRFNMLAGTQLNYGNAVGNGGGVYVSDGARFSANYANIHLNSAHKGGGIYIAGADGNLPMVNILAGSVRANHATSLGAAIFSDWGTVTVDRVKIYDNSATSGVVMELLNSGSTLINTLIYGNSGIDLFGVGAASSMSLQSSTIISDAAAAAFYVTSNISNISITGSIFSDFSDTATGPGSITSTTCSLDSTAELGSDLPPLFTNPATRNYNLTLNSSAIDRCATGPDVDLDLKARPAIGKPATPYDAGAYEYQSPPIPAELIFADGFD